jgi:ABC-type multidrug transport system ATPase subunit
MTIIHNITNPVTSFELSNVSIKKSTPDGKSRWVLEDINLNFQSNHRIGLLGKNGSGKTTLVRVISGLDKISKGRFIIHPQRTRIIIVLQRPEEHFLRSSVGEQVNSYAPRSLSPNAIYALIKRVGLSVDVARWPPIRLSTGQQRLVAIACAIATGSQFLVFDEPMAGLDAYGRHLVRQALINVHNEQDLGWIIVSHHPDDLLGLVNRLWILDQGKLVDDHPFPHPNLSKLNICLSNKDTSLYYRLSMLENQGISIPDEIYNEPVSENILSIFRRVRFS